MSCGSVGDNNNGKIEKGSNMRGLFLGKNNIARLPTSIYYGVNYKAKKINKIYIGVGNKAKIVYGYTTNYVRTKLATMSISPCRQTHESSGSETLGNYLIFSNYRSSGKGYTYNKSLTLSQNAPIHESSANPSSTSIGDSYALFGGGYNSWLSYITRISSSLVKSTMTRLTGDKAYVGTATIYGHAIFLGGYNPSSGISNYVTDVYNYSTKQNTFQLPSAFYYPSGTNVGDYAVFTYDGVAIAYNYSLTQTIPTNPSISRRSNLGMVAGHVGKYALFIGGSTNSSQYSSMYVDVYNDSLTLSTITPSTKREYSSAVNYIDDDGIESCLFVGGSDGSSPLNSVSKYDSSLTASSLQTLSKYASMIICGQIGNYVLCIGGSTNSGNSNITDAYNKQYS